MWGAILVSPTLESKCLIKDLQTKKSRDYRLFDCGTGILANKQKYTSSLSQECLLKKCPVNDLGDDWRFPQKIVQIRFSHNGHWQVEDLKVIKNHPKS